MKGITIHSGLKKVFILVVLAVNLSYSQGVSILPSQLSESDLGSWVDEKNNITLIIRENYIVVQNVLFYYNEIVKYNEELSLTCVNDSDVKYISITKIDQQNIFLDEGNKITKLSKHSANFSSTFPKSLIGTWYASEDKLKIQKDKILFSNDTYAIDCVIPVNSVNYYFVLYKEGNYYLGFNSVGDYGHLLNIDVSKELFKKESFFQKYRTVFIILAILLLLASIYLFIRRKVRLAKKKEVAKRMFTEMQLKSIRSQMNPHFLFNALSAIQNLINKGDNDNANHYLTEFSRLMRLTLDKSEKGIVPLQDEIESIKKYLELEKLRFPFRYSIKISSEISTKQIEIPGMLIQPYVENAIIHGLKEKHEDKILSIEFKIEDGNLLCLIEDNGIGIKASKAKKNNDLRRDKYGMKLAKDRIQLINESYKTNARVKVTDISKEDINETGTLVEVYLPLMY